MVRRGVVVVLCAVVFLACGRPSAPEPGGDRPEQTSIDGGWRLVDGRGPGGQIPKGDDIRITLDIEGSSLSGRSACNHYFSEIRETSDAFILDGVGGTEMGCEESLMRAEDLYLEALTDVDSRRMEGEVLVLAGAKTELLFKRVPPVPTAELVDTAWRLEGVIQGSGNEATVGSAHPATLMLHGNGRLAGSTGCRELTGRWEERPGHIAVPELSAEGSCAKDLRPQDGQVVQVIGDGFTVEIDGSSLTVSDVLSSAGLIYRAD